jgi:hypothetical protein
MRTMLFIVLSRAKQCAVLYEVSLLKRSIPMGADSFGCRNLASLVGSVRAFDRRHVNRCAGLGETSTRLSLHHTVRSSLIGDRH